MKRLISAIVLLLPLAPISAQAQKIDCENASSTVEMNFCAEKDFKAADKDLNVAYANAVAFIKERKLDKPYDFKSFEEALRTAQRTWLAYRDSDCKDLIAQEWSGGSGTAAASLECMTAKTIERTRNSKTATRSIDGLRRRGHRRRASYGAAKRETFSPRSFPPPNRRYYRIKRGFCVRPLPGQ